MQKFEIETPKGYAIVGTEFLADLGATKTVLIASATGVKQSYYAPFALFLSHNGVNTYTFDYSGIGASLGTSIKKADTSASNWGQVDLEALIGRCKKQHPKNSLTVIGHSIGGQIIGLAPSCNQIDTVILVAAQSGYWRFWNGIGRLKMFVNWHFLFPILTRMFGYFPGEKVSSMENLPQGVALEWRKWCTAKNYLFDCLPQQQLYYGQIDTTLVSYSVSDDVYAPKAAVDWLSKKYENATQKRIHLSPKTLGQNSIGHFGFFKEKVKPTFWQSLLAQL